MRAVSSVRMAVATVLASLTMSILGPVSAVGQNRVGFEGRAGVGLPAFDLADRADAGFAVGLDLTYALTDRVAVVGGGDVEFLQGSEREATGLARPDLTAWHYGAGVEAQLLDPLTTYWRLRTGVGVGASTYDGEGSGSETAFSLFGNLELGYEVSVEADLFVALKTWLAFPGERPLTGDGSQSSDPLTGVGDTAWSFPVLGGIRFHF